MALTSMPYVVIQEFTNSGDPAAGYKLFTYDAGTTTKRATYSDSAGSSANANPIILDSAGRATVFCSPTSYKYVLAPPTDTDPPVSPIWTRDNVSSSGSFTSNVDVEGTAGETIATNDVCYLSDGSGALTAGRWYKADADFTYSSNAAVALGLATAGIASGSTGTFRRNGRLTGLSGLTIGAPYYVSATAGAMTVTAPANAIALGKADSTTSIVLDPYWGVAGSAIIGLMGTDAQTFSGVKTFNSQPIAYGGAATTLPATVGGVFFTDVVLHTAPQNSTDLVLSTTTIPANMLNANGKAIRVFLGKADSTAETGANQKDVELVISGLELVVRTGTGIVGSWSISVLATRIDSDSLDIAWEQINAGAYARSVSRRDAVDFTAAITVKSQGTTGATSTVSQTYFIVELVG